MNERFSRSGKDIEFEQFFYCEILIKIHELKDAGGGENGNHLINRIREDKMWNLFKWFWTSNTEEKLDIKERIILTVPRLREATIKESVSLQQM